MSSCHCPSTKQNNVILFDKLLDTVVMNERKRFLKAKQLKKIYFSSSKQAFPITDSMKTLDVHLKGSMVVKFKKACINTKLLYRDTAQL